MAEPKVIYAAVHEGEDAAGDQCWNINCRFDDGQKYVAVEVAYEMEELAHFIAAALTSACNGWKLAPPIASHDMTSAIVQPGEDRTKAVSDWAAMLAAVPDPLGKQATSAE